ALRWSWRFVKRKECRGNHHRAHRAHRDSSVISVLCGEAHRRRSPRTVEKLPPCVFRGILGAEVKMSVEDRIEELQEQMEALYSRKVEVKTVREWLADDGYVPPENPSNFSADVRTLIDHLADIGVILEFADHVSDRDLYTWLIEQLGAHMTVMTGSFLHVSPIGACSEEDNQIYLTYYATDE